MVMNRDIGNAIKKFGRGKGLYVVSRIGWMIGKSLHESPEFKLW